VASRPEAREGDGARWASRSAVDAVVGAIAFAVGVAVMVDSAHMGAGWAGGTLQPGYFPFRIGAVICIAAVSIVVRALLRLRHDGTGFVRRERFLRVLAVLGPMLAYILAVAYLGIYVASAVFVAGFMRVAGRYGWVKCALVGVASAAVLFWLFEIQFLVPLPKGPLEAWLGY
jgi:hypothetical protein